MQGQGSRTKCNVQWLISSSTPILCLAGKVENGSMPDDPNRETALDGVGDPELIESELNWSSQSSSVWLLESSK
jgi:hypothetical protein